MSSVLSPNVDSKTASTAQGKCKRIESAFSMEVRSSSSQADTHAAVISRLVAVAMVINLEPMAGLLVGFGVKPRTGLPSSWQCWASRRQRPATAISHRWSRDRAMVGVKRWPEVAIAVPKSGEGKLRQWSR